MMYGIVTNIMKMKMKKRGGGGQIFSIKSYVVGFYQKRLATTYALWRTDGN